MNSKFFTVMLAATLIFALAAVALQALEMNHYELFETLFKK